MISISRSPARAFALAGAVAAALQSGVARAEPPAKPAPDAAITAAPAPAPAAPAAEAPAAPAAAAPAPAAATAAPEPAAQAAAQDGAKAAADSAVPAPSAVPSSAPAVAPPTASAPPAGTPAEPARTGAMKTDSAQAEAPAAPVQSLSVATGSGAYAAAFKRIVADPFTAATAIRVTAPAAGAQPLDVVALDAAAVAAKCDSGELRPLPAGLAPGSDDSVADIGSRCGVATFAWASVFVYEPQRFAKRAPRTLKDVFNTKAFPGVRALPRNARAVLEAALIADGVAAADVYARLASPEGIGQALAEVATLGSDVVWFDKADDALDLLRSGKAAIALTSNSRAFFDAARRGPLEVIWDGQVYDVEYLAITKSSRNAEAAERFLAFATEPQRLAAIAREIPYGPMRRSAVAEARTHAVTGSDLEPFMPTAPDNLATAVRFDPSWWRDNGAAVAKTIVEATRQRPSGAAPAPPTRQTQR